MKHWYIKAITQKVISLLPFGRSFNLILQQNLTRGLVLTPSFFEDKLAQVRFHHCAYRKSASGIPQHCLELGSGWHPVVPVALYLLGAKRIVTLDVVPMLNRNRVIETLRMFVRNDNLPGKYIPVIPERMKDLRHLLENHSESDLHEILERLNIQYLTGNTVTMKLPAKYFDLVFSNNTLQHIYADALPAILANIRSAGKATTVHSHFIDLIDQFHHFDRRLNRYNFLRYSPAKWKWIDNSIVHQNRLRIDDYRELLRSAGFTIAQEENNPGFPDELAAIPLHETFRQKSPETNAVIHSYIVAYARSE